MPEKQVQAPSRDAPSVDNSDADANREAEQRAVEGPRPGSRTVAGGKDPKLHP